MLIGVVQAVVIAVAAVLYGDAAVVVAVELVGTRAVGGWDNNDIMYTGKTEEGGGRERERERERERDRQTYRQTGSVDRQTERGGGGGRRERERERDRQTDRLTD